MVWSGHSLILLPFSSKVLSVSRLGGAAAVAPLVADMSSNVSTHAACLVSLVISLHSPLPLRKWVTMILFYEWTGRRGREK